MNCCYCSRNTFTTVEGIALCQSCHTDFQNTLNNNVSSALQLSRGSDVANSMNKARTSLIERQAKNQRNSDIHNYNTHTNITISGDNNGSVQAGMNQTQNSNIRINNLSKSSNDNVGWLAKIIANGLKRFWTWLIGFFG